MSERFRGTGRLREPGTRGATPAGTARWMRPAGGKGGWLRVHKGRRWSWDGRVRCGQIVLTPDAVGGSRRYVHGSDGDSRAPAG
jgi:hypothetical protein